MMNTKQITTAALIVVAIILLIVINKQEVPSEEVTSQTSPRQSDGQVDSQGSPVSLSDINNPDGTLNAEKQKAYLFSVTDNSPDEERAAHYQYAVSIAERSEHLNVTGCDIVPLVLELAHGEEIVLKNDSDANVTISLNEATAYEVKAKSTASIALNFSKGPGLYGYGCADSTGTRGAGMALVTPKP